MLPRTQHFFTTDIIVKVTGKDIRVDKANLRLSKTYDFAKPEGNHEQQVIFDKICL